MLLGAYCNGAKEKKGAPEGPIRALLEAHCYRTGVRDRGV